MSESTWRPATPADYPALAALRTAIHRNGDELHPTAAGELTHEFGALDPATDTLLAVGPDGVLGWAAVFPPYPGGDRVDVRGGVHPDARGRGLGRRLLAWQIERAGAYPGAYLHSRVNAANASAVALVSRLGFAPDRSMFQMVRPFRTPAPVNVPTGLRIIPYDAAHAERLWAAHMAAFAEHWGFAHAPLDRWLARTVGHPRFRADLSFLALDGEDIAGYLLAYGDAALLTIGQVGTVEAWRGRGIAAALLDANADAGHAAGIDQATLFVDSENTTGALGVYERNGYHQVGTWIAMTMTLVVRSRSA